MNGGIDEQGVDQSAIHDHEADCATVRIFDQPLLRGGQPFGEHRIDFDPVLSGKEAVGGVDVVAPNFQLTICVGGFSVPDPHLKSGAVAPALSSAIASARESTC